MCRLRYPTYQPIFGQAEEVCGAGPPLIAALRDFQIQLEPRVNRNGGRTCVHAPRAG